MTPTVMAVHHAVAYWYLECCHLTVQRRLACSLKNSRSAVPADT